MGVGEGVKRVCSGGVVGAAVGMVGGWGTPFVVGVLGA